MAFSSAIMFEHISSVKLLLTRQAFCTKKSCSTTEVIMKANIYRNIVGSTDICYTNISRVKRIPCTHTSIYSPFHTMGTCNSFWFFPNGCWIAQFALFHPKSIPSFTILYTLNSCYLCSTHLRCSTRHAQTKFTRSCHDSVL